MYGFWDLTLNYKSPKASRSWEDSGYGVEMIGY